MTQANFQPRGYLKFDLSQGQVLTPDEQRHLVVPADLIMAAGDGATLEEAALRWGRQQGRALASLVGDDVLEQPPERFVTELSHLLATLGWGWCELESWAGVLFVVLRHALRGGASAIMASFLAGAFSAASGREISCLAIDDEGRFLLTDPELVGIIGGWINEGAGLEEVVRRMLSGEQFSGALVRGDG